MARKKNSVALFEVISRSKERRSQAGLDVPSWMGGRRGQAEQPEPAPPPRPAEQPARPSPPPAGEALHEPVFSTSGGRLRVSLNYTGAIVLGVAVVLLLGAAFAIGRATAGGGTAAKPAAPAGTDAGEGSGESEPAGNTPQRAPGKQYLVIRDFDTGSGLWSEAERIAEFCTAHGEPAEVQTLTDRHTGEPFIAVWSLKPFDRPDSQAAENYKRKLQELGEQYYEQHKSFRFNPWYAPYNPQS